MTSITQETANLIDTLAGAAAKIGSTKASAKLNELIVDLIPPTADIALAALKVDNAELEEHLETLATAMKDVKAKLEAIIALDPADTEAAAHQTQALKTEVEGFLFEIGE